MIPLARLLQLLACPACSGRLTPDATAELLRCGCGLAYPVVDGIPRIFVGEMRRIYGQDFPAVVRRYPELGTTGTERSTDVRAKLRTRESFGYEWTVYNEMLPEWEENARFYFELVGLPALSGRLVLDAGCGKGRHSFYAARAGAEVVALDFSRAIDVTRRNCGSSGRIGFVQGDLTAPPFRRGTFDLVYSFGVLHHLPDPEGGFRACVSLVRPGGNIAIYLYHSLQGQPIQQALLRAVSALRVVTTRMPHPALRAFSWLAGTGLYLGVVVPFKLLSRSRPTSRIAARLPLQAYAKYPMRVIINDQFDRFSAPIENRYRQEEVQGWLERAGLDELRVLPGSGWRAAGRVPQESPAGYKPVADVNFRQHA